MTERYSSNPLLSFSWQYKQSGDNNDHGVVERWVLPIYASGEEEKNIYIFTAVKPHHETVKSINIYI